MDSQGNIIDQNLNTTTIQYPVSIYQTLITTYSVKLATDNAGTFNANTFANVLMYICIQVPVAIPKTTSLSLSIPLAKGSPSDFLIGSKNTVKANLLNSAGIITGYSFLLGSLIALSDPVITNNNILISLSALPASTVPNKYVYIFLSSDSSSTLPAFTLPYISTNLATRYEALLNFTVQGTEYLATQALTILPSSLGASASLLCTDKTTPGIPLTVIFTPPQSYALTTGYSLIVEVEFDANYPNDLGSGISGSYPAQTNINQVNFTLVSTSIAEVRMSGLTSVSSLKTYTFAFPVGSMANQLSINVQLYFVYHDRTDVEYLTMLTSITTVGTTPAIPFGSITSSTIPLNNVLPANPLIDSLFFIEFSPYLSAGSYTSGYAGLIMPQGFMISKPTVTLTSDSGLIAPVLYSFSSLNTNFKFPSIYFGLTASIALTTSTPSITVNSFTAPSSSSTSSPFVILAPAVSGACIASGSGSPIQVTPATLLTPQLSPPIVIAKGPTSLITTISIAFTISYPISGAIVIVLNSN